MAKAAETLVNQLPLAKMKHGLVKPIATVQCEPRDLSRKLGISFEVTQDDLDEVEAALIRANSGREFALVKHRHQPHPGTDILTVENSADLARDLRDVLQLLRISPDDLSWIHPEIESAEKAAQSRGWRFFKKVPQTAALLREQTKARSGDDPPLESVDQQQRKGFTREYKKFADEHAGKDVLSSDVEIKGTITFKKELLIDGKVEGDIYSDGVITVGENADIRGDIKTKSIILYGKVRGDITVSERCELKSRCMLQGNLSASRLIIEEGATFIGKSEVSSGMAVKAAGRPEVVRHEDIDEPFEVRA